MASPSDTPTPRTDAIVHPDDSVEGLQLRNLAETLERELAEARADSERRLELGKRAVIEAEAWQRIADEQRAYAERVKAALRAALTHIEAQWPEGEKYGYPPIVHQLRAALSLNAQEGTPEPACNPQCEPTACPECPIVPKKGQACPTCEGTNPAHHPATSVGGEVFLCRDPWHQPTADEIEAKERASFRSGVTWADATTMPLGRWAELCEKGHGQTVAVEIRQAMSLVEVEARPSPGDVSDTERMRDGWFHAEQALNKACWLLHRIDGAAKQIPENVEGYLEPLSEVIVDVRAFLNPGNAAEGVKP
jgi:hypothetical protein